VSHSYPRKAEHTANLKAKLDAFEHEERTK